MCKHTSLLFFCTLIICFGPSFLHGFRLSPPASNKTVDASKEYSLNTSSSTLVSWIEVSSYGKIILDRPDPGGVEDGNPLFVCRAVVSNLYKPGKLWLASGQYYCAVSHEGTEHKISTFEMLQASPGAISWVLAAGGLPSNAIIGGAHAEGNVAYICRGVLNGDLLIGNCRADVGECWVTRFGNEYIIRNNIEVLVVNAYGLIS